MRRRDLLQGQAGAAPPGRGGRRRGRGVDDQGALRVRCDGVHASSAARSACAWRRPPRDPRRSRSPPWRLAHECCVRCCCCVANLGFFAWTQGWLDGVVSAARTATASPSAWRAVPAPTHADPAAGPAARRRPSRASARARRPQACLEAGPFDAAAGAAPAAEAATWPPPGCREGSVGKRRARSAAVGAALWLRVPRAGQQALAGAAVPRARRPRFRPCARALTRGALRRGVRSRVSVGQATPAHPAAPSHAADRPPRRRTRRRPARPRTVDATLLHVEPMLPRLSVTVTHREAAGRRRAQTLAVAASVALAKPSTMPPPSVRVQASRRPWRRGDASAGRAAERDRLPAGGAAATTSMRATTTFARPRPRRRRACPRRRAGVVGAVALQLIAAVRRVARRHRRAVAVVASGGREGPRRGLQQALRTSAGASAGWPTASAPPCRPPAATRSWCRPLMLKLSVQPSSRRPLRAGVGGGDDRVQAGLADADVDAVAGRARRARSPGPRSEKPTLVPAWRSPHRDHARAVGRRAHRPAGAVAGGGDDHRAGGRDAVDHRLVAALQAPAAAQAQVDDAAPGSVGRHAAAPSQPGRPAHGGLDVGVVAVALAEHAHRQHAHAGRAAGHADGRCWSAAPIRLAVWVPCQLLGDSSQPVKLPRPASAAADPVAGVAGVGVAPVAVVGDRGVGDEVVARQQVAAVGRRGSGRGGRSARRCRAPPRPRRGCRWCAPRRLRCRSPRRCRPVRPPRAVARAGTTGR